MATKQVAALYIAAGVGIGACYRSVHDKVDAGLSNIVPKTWEGSWTKWGVSHLISVTASVVAAGGCVLLISKLLPAAAVSGATKVAMTLGEQLKVASTPKEAADIIGTSAKDVLSKIHYIFKHGNEETQKTLNEVCKSLGITLHPLLERTSESLLPTHDSPQAKKLLGVAAEFITDTVGKSSH